jgi:hypothetical protein
VIIRWPFILVCGLLVALAAPPAAAAAPQPDLIVDAYTLQRWMSVTTQTFAPSDCAVQEGAISSAGTHKLITFDTAVVNAGKGDMRLGKPDSTSGNWEFYTCHNHWHFLKFAEYKLLDSQGNIVGLGHKESFCVEDLAPFYTWASHPNHAFYTCSKQGLTSGWYDLYGANLIGQWIEIDSVPPGTYTVVVTVNYANVLEESNYANNTTSATVTIP